MPCSSALPEMSLLPITSEATLQACRSFLPRNDNDSHERVFWICSYPKSGTTWTQNLVCRLLAAALGQPLPHDWHLSHSAPFYEADAYWTKEGVRVPERTSFKKERKYYRVFNTHLLPHQLPKNAKCIYVMRDALDVMASFYFHMANMAESDGGYTQSTQAFCQEFVEGTIAYGKWQHHMEAWLKGTAASANNNVLFLHYQDMKENLVQQATRVARFLLADDDENNNIGSNDEFLSRILKSTVPHCTFDAMRKERFRYTPQSVSWNVDEATGQPYQDFVRAGRVGDGAVFFNEYGTFELKQKWEKDLQTARDRWSHAVVDPDIIARYLPI